jgi:hypothetical protein
MWICLNDAFVSIVAHTDRPDDLLIRARRREHLVAVVGRDVPVDDWSGTDYRFRSTLPRVVVADEIRHRVASIEYPNFKDSVSDKHLSALYHRFWHDHRSLGVSDRGSRS